jgi:hypothetical protein
VSPKPFAGSVYRILKRPILKDLHFYDSNFETYSYIRRKHTEKMNTGGVLQRFECAAGVWKARCTLPVIIKRASHMYMLCQWICEVQYTLKTSSNLPLTV